MVKSNIEVLRYFNDKYKNSSSYIAELPEIGPLCISIIKTDSLHHVYCRSILGTREFVYNENETEGIIVMICADEYFRIFVKNWDAHRTLRRNFFEHIFSFIRLNASNALETKLNLTLREELESCIVCNIEEFRIERLMKKFAKISYLYIEEVENFILRGFARIENTREMADAECLNKIVVSKCEIDDAEIKYKPTESGLPRIVKEFLDTELHLHDVMTTLFRACCKTNMVDAIARNIDNHTQMLGNEMSNDDYVDDLARLFDESTDSTDNGFGHRNNEPISHLLKFEELCILIKLDKYGIKFANDLAEILDKSDAAYCDSGNEAAISCNINDSAEEQNTKGDILPQNILIVLTRNTQYFDTYKEFVTVYNALIDKTSLDTKLYEKIADTCNTILQSLTRYPLFVSKIISHIPRACASYCGLKEFLVRLKKFIHLVDKQQDLMYRRRKSRELMCKYREKDMYIDEVFDNRYRYILLEHKILIVSKEDISSCTIAIKNVDVHEIGDKSLCLMCKDKVDVPLYYSYNLGKYVMNVLYIKCLSNGIRTRFVRNLRSQKQLFQCDKQKIKYKIIKDDQVYHIPNFDLQDEEWLCMKYRFIMNEVIVNNTNTCIEDLTKITS